MLFLALSAVFMLTACDMFSPLGNTLHTTPDNSGNTEPTQATPWGAPQNLAAVSGMAQWIDVSWTPVEGASHYLISYSRDMEDDFETPNDQVAQGPDLNVPVTWRLTDGATHPLDSGEVYYFRIRAVKSNGQRSPLSEFAVAGSLDTPQTAVPVLSPGSVKLRWTLPNLAVEGVDYTPVFTVLRADAGGDPVPVSVPEEIEQNGVVYSFENTGVAPNSQYTYIIRAAVDGNSVYRESAGVEVTTEDQPFPNAVQNMAASRGTSADSVSLSWDAPEDLPGYTAYDTAYTLIRNQQGGGNVVLAEKTVGLLSFTDDGSVSPVEENTVYTYSVTPYFVLDTQGSVTTYSEAGTPAEEDGYRLWVPENVQAVKNGSDVLVSWDYPADKMDGVHFCLYREEDAVGGEEIQLADNLDTPSFTDSTIEDGKAYYYRVEAVNGSQTSRGERTEQPVGFEAPSQPMIVNPQASGGHQADITVEWSGVQDAVYRIYGNADGYAYTEADLLADNLSVDASNNGVFTETLSPGTVRYYRIEALKDGNTEYTLPLRGFVLGIPSGLNASQGEYKNKIHLVWNAVEGATSYRLLYREAGSTSEFNVHSPDLLPSDLNNPAGDFVPPGNADPSLRGIEWEMALQAVRDPGTGSPYVSTEGAAATGCTLGPALAHLQASCGESAEHVLLQWDAVTGAEFYDIYRNTDSNPDTAVRIMQGLTHTQAEDSDTPALSQGIKYYYFIRALSSSVSSNILSPGVEGFIISPPGGVTAHNYASADTIELSWQPHPEAQGAAGATYSYNVYQKSSGSGWFKISSTAAGQTSYSFPLSSADITSGNVEKEFSITSVNSSGMESAMPENPVTGSALSRPMSVSASQGDSSLKDASGQYYTRVFWESVPGAETYRVERRDDRSPDWMALGTVPAPGASGTVEFRDFTALALKNLRQDYRVRCERSGGVETIWSDEAQGYRQISAEEFLNMVNYTLRRSMDKLFYDTGYASGSLKEGSVSGDAEGTYTHGIDRNGFFGTNYRRYYEYQDYKDYFLTLNGSFMKDHGGGVSANSRHGEYKHRDPEDTPVLTVTGPYSGTVRFENVNVSSDNGNSPGWDAGQFVVVFDGQTVTFDSSSSVPIPYFMDEDVLIGKVAQ